MHAVWRIIVALSLIPAFGTLYQRLTLPESRRFQAARQMDEEDPVVQEKKAHERALKKLNNPDAELHSDSGSEKHSVNDEAVGGAKERTAGPRPEVVVEEEQGLGTHEAVRRKRAHFKGMSLGLVRSVVHGNSPLTHRIRRLFLRIAACTHFDWDMRLLVPS